MTERSVLEEVTLKISTIRALEGELVAVYGYR